MTLAPERRLLPVFGFLSGISLLYLGLLPLLFQAFLGSALAFASRSRRPRWCRWGWPWEFPTGIQIVRRVNESFVPWAWGINGCASVVGTVLAVILAMAFGFRIVTLLAIGIYLLAVLGLRSSASRFAV